MPMKGWAGVLLWSALLAGCTSLHLLHPPDPTAEEMEGTSLPIDPLYRKVIAAVKSYYPQIDLATAGSEEMAPWLSRITPGSSIQKVPPSSLNFIRGLEPERSVDPIAPLAPSIFYLKVSFWGRRTVAEATRQIAGKRERMEQPGGGLILDLRGNRGGQVDAALEMVNTFLPAGRTVATIHPVRGESAPYRTSFPDPYRFPVVLLVDHQTASSSELFSGILQHEKRAVLIGMQTAGKDTIQSAIPLDPEHLLLLTTGHFELPGQPRLLGKGLAPDDPVQEEDNPEDRAQVFFKRPDLMSGNKD